TPITSGCTHRPTTSSGLRPCGLDLVDGVLRALTRDPRRGLLPEGVRSDRCRHLVRTVEAEDRLRVREDVVRELVDRARQVGALQALVGADPATARGGLSLLVRPG